MSMEYRFTFLLCDQAHAQGRGGGSRPLHPHPPPKKRNIEKKPNEGIYLEFWKNWMLLSEMVHALF